MTIKNSHFTYLTIHISFQVFVSVTLLKTSEKGTLRKNGLSNLAFISRCISFYFRYYKVNGS